MRDVAARGRRAQHRWPKSFAGPRRIALLGRLDWSTRTLAAAAGLGATTVRTIWQAHGLKPHLAATFKVSNDPRFAEKLEDIVGLYLAAPEHALVLCCDEPSGAR